MKDRAGTGPASSFCRRLGDPRDHPGAGYHLRHHPWCGARATRRRQGGGRFLPFYIGRFNRAYAKRPECQENITKPPSDYLRQVYFDTVLFDARSLAYLAGLVGAGRLVMGTDRPYDMSEDDPAGFIGSAEGLSDAEKHDILGVTTARLLDLG